MERKELVLGGLAAAGGASHTPVQVQKLFFLIERNIAALVGGPHFDFEPHNYGPFDKRVYEELEALAVEGLVEMLPERTWNNYRLSPIGQTKGESVLSALPQEAREYIEKASAYVRSLSFTQLVSAIYRAYPEMRANSVFQD